MKEKKIMSEEWRRKSQEAFEDLYRRSRDCKIEFNAVTFSGNKKKVKRRDSNEIS